MDQFITIALTPLQAAIVSLAMQEYQSDFEANLNGITISGKDSIQELSELNSAAVECELITKAIDIQLNLFK